MDWVMPTRLARQRVQALDGGLGRDLATDTMRGIIAGGSGNDG